MTGDRAYLDVLAEAVTTAGWSGRIREDVRLRLQVRHPALPWELGETVTVASGPGGPYYRASTGALLARCTDAQGAVAAIEQLLAGYMPART